MQKILITILITVLVSFSSFAQTTDKEFKGRNDQIKILGEASYKRLHKAPFNEWYVKNEKSYNPEEEIIQQLKEKANSIDSITIFMGTWCGDSKREVPRFTKILKSAKYDLKKIKIVCLDNNFTTYKKSPDGQEAGLNIHRVPTIIMHQNGKELNRIVERPVVSLETDFLSVIDGSYKPSYAIVDFVDKFLENEGVSELAKYDDNLMDDLKSKAVRYSELNTYAKILLTSWRIEEALAVYELNTKLFPEEENSHINRANVLLILGYKKEAKECCKRALALNPESKIAKQLMDKAS